MRGPVNLLRALVVATLLAALLPVPVAAQVRNVNFLYSFGDSLSDTGNIFATTKALGLDPAIPPSESPHRTYDKGRFSNGPVAVEYLWQFLTGIAPDTPGGVKPILASPGFGSSKAVNFAFGGTGTDYLDQTPGGLWAPGLKGQVDLFRVALNGRKPSKRALYVIATGSNDYRDDAFNVPMSPPDVVQNIVEAVATLYDLGAREVMVFDLPDPAFLPGGDPSGVGSLIAAWHNELLAQGLATLAAQLPQLHITPIHLNDLFPNLPSLGFEPTTPALALLVPDPGPFGVPTYSCLFVLPAACQDANFDVIGQLGLPFAFWDIVHPTTDAHRVLGQFLYHALDQ
jgi:phospholipase/lecithinase/hemolysin